MKQVLSMDQVNARLSANSNLHCYKIEYNRYNDQPYYYLILKNQDLVIAFGKKVFYHEAKGENYSRNSAELIFDDKKYLPLIDKKEAEKLLTICGLIPEKQVKEVKPEQRLKEICGQSLSIIYKMMLGLHDINADLIEKEDYHGYKFLALQVSHSRGQFSFPIENLAIDPDYTDEAQNIFFNALNLPVTSKLKTA